MVNDYEIIEKYTRDQDAAIKKAVEVRTAKKRRWAISYGLDNTTAYQYTESQLDTFLEEVTK